MSDSTYKKVKEYLVQQGYRAVSDETYEHIDEWLEWYQNDAAKFHHYKLYNGIVTTNQERYKLGMAKTVCEDWANLLLNERVTINAGDYNERLAEILKDNNFQKQGNQLIEKAFALGTGAFVEYLDADKQVIIDYIRADMIYPLSWDNGDITECAFGTQRTISGEKAMESATIQSGFNSLMCSHTVSSKANVVSTNICVEKAKSFPTRTASFASNRCS